MRSVDEFCAWLETRGVALIAAVGSTHVAAYVEDLGYRHSAPTVKTAPRGHSVLPRISGHGESATSEGAVQKLRSFCTAV